MAQKTTGQDVGLRRIWGLVLLPVCVFVLLSLFSYDWHDISLLQAPPNPSSNLIGPVGAWLSFFFFMLFGIGAYLVPVWCFVFGIILLFDMEERVWPRGMLVGCAALCVVLLMSLGEAFWTPICNALNITHPGGLFGRLIMQGMLIRWLSPVGASILVTCLLVVTLVFLVELRNWVVFCRLLARISTAAYQKVAAMITDWLHREEEQSPVARTTVTVTKPPRPTPAVETIEPVEMPQETIAPSPPAPIPEDDEYEEHASDDSALHGIGDNYKMPPLALLSEASTIGGIEMDTTAVSEVLVNTLAHFGIDVQVTHVERGPVVTRYELLPAPGVKVQKITTLHSNLQMALKANGLRLQAPVPGKGVVGIEVPNSTAQIVCLREVLETSDLSWDNCKLPLALGKDVGGANLVADLTKMPHMLVAGATGAGKTVCTNAILTGLLMSRTPEQVRFMLIDPKIVEFSVYNNLPHLVVPVITDANKVPLGLRWAINEMDKRYKLFAKVGVRDISSYNSRLIVSQVDMFEEDPAPKKGTPPDRIPYIVIIIDELADLMLSKDRADIENSIARLAQLSRAVGIHMILSTQRPSVDVITGTIKANFPARVAFQVAQKTDSRTILDNMGAETLLGRGDMLFLEPGASRLLRAQGALVLDDEIRKVVSFIKQQSEPDYELEIKAKLETTGNPALSSEDEDDELLSQAVAIIRETQRASTSSLQRRLRIGYTRAARVMDILENKGVIGPPRGSEPREILIDLDGEIPNNPEEEDTEEPI